MIIMMQTIYVSNDLREFNEHFTVSCKYLKIPL